MPAPSRVARSRRLRLALLPGLLGLLLAEAVARLVLGAPPATLVRHRFNTDTALFSVHDGKVSADFQQQDLLPPFSATPTLPRVMVFGESSVRGGSHLPPEQEFAGLLGARLAGTAEVLNLGRPALDSHSIGPIVHAALRFGPTVAVLYQGHNDLGNAWFEQRYPDDRSLALTRVRITLGRTWTYRLLTRAVNRAIRPSIPGDRFMANLLPQGDLAAVSPSARARAEADFAANLDATVRDLQAAGVRVVLATVVSDLSRWTTALASCPDVLPPGNRDNGGQTWPHLDLAAATQIVRQAPACPEAEHLYGQRLQEAGHLAEGRAAMVWARDHDPQGTRATTAIVEATRAVASRRGATLVDLDAALADVPAATASARFEDQVHPNAAGHAWIAEMLLPAVSAAVGR